jgi:hypothetical protein
LLTQEEILALFPGLSFTSPSPSISAPSSQILGESSSGENSHEAYALSRRFGVLKFIEIISSSFSGFSFSNKAQI